MNEILTQEKSIYLQIAEMIETDILRDSSLLFIAGLYQLNDFFFSKSDARCFL